MYCGLLGDRLFSQLSLVPFYEPGVISIPFLDRGFFYIELSSRNGSYYCFEIDACAEG
jgi:hypothetical protein